MECEGLCIEGPDFERSVAAGPTARDALAHALALGFEGWDAFPVSPAEVDEAGLSPEAAGAVEGERPWWRETDDWARL